MNQSTHTLLTSLWINLLIFAGELVAFTILRVVVKEIYEPRTLDKTKSPPPDLTTRWYAWPLAIAQLSTKDVKKAGLDSYFFLRFLRMMIIAFAPITFFSWIVLLPLNSMGETAGQTGLNRFTIGNVAVGQESRYWAHLLCLWTFTIWICYLIKAEMSHFIAQRQMYLVSDEYKSSPHASTLLVSGIPREDMNKKKLTDIFSGFGPVHDVWLLRDYGDIPSLYERHIEAVSALEAAETKLIALALKRSDDLESGTSVYDFFKDQRPTRRLPIRVWGIPIPMFCKCKTVDAINWACQEIFDTAKELDKERRVFVTITGDHSDEVKKMRLLNSAIIMWKRQISAHLAFQSVISKQPYTMSFKSIQVSPKDIVWANLRLSNYEHKIRQVAGVLITIVLIILWSFPAAFIGATSNISSLCQTYRWLSWICGLGPTAIGIIEGILPSVLLSISLLLLPMIFRLMGRFEGIPLESKIELSVMNRFFSFQIINSFLIITLSSGIIASLPVLVKNPASIAELLATNLPKASNFFLSYTILQGLSGTAMGFLQVGPLLVYFAQRMFVGNAPRSVYNVKFALRHAVWGAVFPPVTLIAVISIAYSVISPVINALAFTTFILFLLLWRYLVVYQYEEPEGSDTGGLFFPLAIQHVFVGLYIQQICLAALFFLARDRENKASAIVEGVFSVVLIFVTAMFHILLNHSYAPLIHTLPITMVDKSFNGDGQKDFVDHKVKDVDFQHPAISKPLPIIWLPEDPEKNFVQQEVQRLSKNHLLAKSTNATMNWSGRVNVTGPPPDGEQRQLFMLPENEQMNKQS